MPQICGINKDLHKMKISLKNKGFTLIEMMIVIAIIGILAAIALPIYQDYVAKAQMTRVFYEISSAKTTVEGILAHGNMPTLNRAADGTMVNNVRQEYLGIDNTPVSNMVFRANLDINGGQFNAIHATLGDNAMAALQGVVLTLSRDPNGVWTCQINPNGSPSWSVKYAPPTCSVI